MNSRKTLTIIMAISLILGSYRSFAQTAEELFPKAIQLEEVKGELEKAIEVYQTIVTKFSANRPIASKAQLHIGLCYEKLGDAQAREARKAYERVVRDYADQAEPTKLARERLSALSTVGGCNYDGSEAVMHRIWDTDNGYNPIAGISQDGGTSFLIETVIFGFAIFSPVSKGKLLMRLLWVEWSFAYGSGLLLSRRR